MLDEVNGYKPPTLNIQNSSLGTVRSGLFYRTDDKVPIVRLDITASF